MADGEQSYVIDTCAIGDLTGENRPTTLYHNPYEVERVWQGIEQLIEARRLATVHQAKMEMRTRCPQGYKRLEHYGRRFFIPRIAPIWNATRQVLTAAAEQRTLIRYATAKANRDPADPYLVGLAIVRDAKIVTSEKGRHERTVQQNEQRIPDLCLAYFGNTGRVIHLEDLVRAEGLLA